VKYTKAIYLYKDKNGKTIIFETKFISMIDVPYKRYILV
jgi:hypothetical protein